MNQKEEGGNEKNNDETSKPEFKANIIEAESSEPKRRGLKQKNNDETFETRNRGCCERKNKRTERKKKRNIKGGNVRKRTQTTHTRE